MQGKKGEAAPITAEELDEKFERGDDVSDYFDFDTAVRRFPASAPAWALKILSDEAKRRGMNREAYIREMIVKRADELRVPAKAGTAPGRRKG